MDFWQCEHEEGAEREGVELQVRSNEVEHRVGMSPAAPRVGVVRRTDAVALSKSTQIW